MIPMRVRLLARPKCWCTAPTAKRLLIGTRSGPASQSERTTNAWPSSTARSASAAMRRSELSSPAAPRTRGQVQSITLVRVPRSVAPISASHSTLLRIGCGKRRRRQCSGPTSRRLPSGPQ